jgi:FeS assembly protein IscX
MGLKWTDTREIAIELSEKFPDVNPMSVRFHGPAQVGDGTGGF